MKGSFKGINEITNNENNEGITLSLVKFIGKFG